MIMILVGLSLGNPNSTKYWDFLGFISTIFDDFCFRNFDCLALLLTYKGFAYACV